MEKQKKSVLVKTFTTQKDEDGKTEFSTESQGTMFVKDGEYFVFYTEHDSDGEKMSDGRITILKDTVEIKRSGAYSSRFVFEEGKTKNSLYSTPYGAMPATLKTRKLISAVDNEGGKIILEYSMTVGGRSFDNRVVINITPLQDGKDM